MTEIPCAECGKLFVPASKRSMCCSVEHRQIHYRKLHREDARRRSKEWHRNNPEKRKAYFDEKLKKVPRFLNCLYCAEQFQASGQQKYCCISHSVKYRRENTNYYKLAHEKNRERDNAWSRRRYRRTRAKTPWKPLLEMAKVRARQKGTPCNLTDFWAANRWTGKCEITGIAFELGLTARSPYSPSIDQIKPGQGYTEDNSRFVLWAINSFKNVGTDEQMFQIAAAITRAHSQSNAALAEGMLSLPA